MTNRRRKSGVLTVELLIAIGLAIAALMALSITLSRQDRAQQRLAQDRADSRRLETALFTLQAGGTPDSSIVITPLEAPAPSPVLTWVRISFSSGDARSLTGLIPRRGAGGGGAP